MRALKGGYDAKRTRIIATTNGVDRDGEVVDPRGCRNLDDFIRSNPVILWQHKHNENPVGKATKGVVHDDRIEMDIEWAPTAMGQEMKALYDGGFMNSFSIGFLPLRSTSKGGQFTWVDWDLLEVSAVSIPANPMATVIRTAESAGISVKALRQTMEDFMYDDATMKAARAEVERELAQKAERERVADMENELQMLKLKDEERRQAKDVEEPTGSFRLGYNPNYKGVNLRKGVDVFANARSARGDIEGAKIARAAEEKTAALIRSMHDMVERADSFAVQRKDQVRGTNNVGGYLTSDDRDSLLAYARKSSVALRHGRIVNMTDNRMTIPREVNKVALNFTNETTEAIETSATFDQVTIDAHDLDGYVDVSMHLEMDSETPIAALLLDQFIESYAMKVDSAVFVGTGDPVSGLFLGGLGGSEVFASGSTAFSQVLASNLFNVIGKLPKERRNGAMWVAGTTALWQHLAQMKDDSGRYLMAGDWGQGVAKRLLGYPVEESYYAPDSAADTVMAVFGDMKGITIGDRLTNLTLFRDPYSLSTYHYTRYVFWTRVAFARTLPNNFITVQTAAA